MGSGKDFEDALMDALENWVGDDGYPMLRKQQMASRRGNFQMSQELDIMVDSRYDDYYVGLEAKSRDVESSAAGLYFSKLNPDQFLSQEEYREVSGRKVAVAVELRNCCGSDDDKNDCAFLLPLDLFVDKIRNDATKVSWDEVREDGVYIGSNGELTITTDHFKAVEDTNRANNIDLSERVSNSVHKYESRSEE